MMMKMPEIMSCESMVCSYNMDSKCRAMAITVGAGDSPLCNTAMSSAMKGGVSEMSGCVGACKVMPCQFKKSLEYTASSVQMKMHSGIAECGTFNQAD